ncbi:hypothetical protein NEMBOFW57_009207 [Staphylotrichum longicolle]|uniref:C2H2-type domain-containing protein n=1 Tax=Staphylotrichum longicolle TaxID=669026 RepID=A0AAD4ESH3_9PEZI|nr:hypothetical protein NEMBOFW57_009207 [Staphylotrichum longicolle]
MPFLRYVIVRRLVSGYQSHAHANNAADTAFGENGTTTTSTSSSSAPRSVGDPSGPSRPSNKRKLPGEDDDDDNNSNNNNNNNNNKPPSKRSKRDPAPNITRLLACPFWKTDSHRHRACFPKILSRIRDVKQHLRRDHYSPFSCPRCATAFPSEHALHDHVSNPIGLFCTPKPPSSRPDRLSQAGFDALSRRSNPKATEEGQWFDLWDFLFPGRARPASAYRPVGVSEELGSFQEFCATNGEAILEDATREVMEMDKWPGFGRLDGEERRSILRWIGRVGFEAAFMRWREERVEATTATTMAVTGGGGGSSRGAMSAQDDDPTPAGRLSRPDSGVVVNETPLLLSVMQSPLEKAGSECRGDEGIVEEGAGLDVAQEAVEEGEGEEDGGREQENREVEGEEEGEAEGEKEGGLPAVANLETVNSSDGYQSFMKTLEAVPESSLGLDERDFIRHNAFTVNGTLG